MSAKSRKVETLLAWPDASQPGRWRWTSVPGSLDKSETAESSSQSMGLEAPRGALVEVQDVPDKRWEFRRTVEVVGPITSESWVPLKRGTYGSWTELCHHVREARLQDWAVSEEVEARCMRDGDGHAIGFTDADKAEAVGLEWRAIEMEEDQILPPHIRDKLDRLKAGELSELTMLFRRKRRYFGCSISRWREHTSPEEGECQGHVTTTDIISAIHLTDDSLRADFEALCTALIAQLWTKPEDTCSWDATGKGIRSLL